MPKREILKTAKEDLKNKTGKALGVIFAEFGIYYAVSLAFVFIFYILIFFGIMTFTLSGSLNEKLSESFANDLGIGMIFLLIGFYLILFLAISFIYPLSFGRMKWFYFNAKGKTLKVGSIFIFFKKGFGYFKCLKLFWQMFLRVLFYAFLFFGVPFGLLVGLELSGVLKAGLGGFSTQLFGGAMIGLFYILYIPFLIFVTRYALSSYIFIEKPTLKAKDCLDMSVALMKGRKIQLVLLYLLTYYPVFIPFVFLIGFAVLMAFVSNLFVIGVVISYIALIILAFVSLFVYYPRIQAATAVFAIKTFEQEGLLVNNIEE